MDGSVAKCTGRGERPAPDPARSSTLADLASNPPDPQGADGLEAVFQDLWRQLLGVGSIRPENGFFELGGTSLDAVSLQLHVLRIFNVELPLHIVYRTPGFGELVAELRTRVAMSGPGPAALGAESAPEPEPALGGEESAVVGRAGVDLPGTIVRTGPPSPAQLAQHLTHRLRPDSTAFIESFAFDLEGPVDADRLRLALRALVVRHESLRTLYAPPTSGSREPLAVVVEELGPEWLELDLRDGAGFGPDETIPGPVWDFASRPIDLARGPMVRALLGRGGGGRSWFVLQFHHIAIDEWSVRILMDELGHLYDLAAGAGGVLAGPRELLSASGLPAVVAREPLAGRGATPMTFCGGGASVSGISRRVCRCRATSAASRGSRRHRRPS